MTGSLTTSVLGILSWMKVQKPGGYMALDEIAAQFHVNPDWMLRTLQGLQRYECVKRGGRGNAEWLITDRGLVRLAEGQFTPSGAFRSRFDRAETLSESNHNEAGQSTVGTVPETPESRWLDAERALPLPPHDRGAA